MHKKIIFSNSYSPRTGHNFVSEALKVFTNHQVLAHGHSETKLSTFLEAYYKIYNEKIYHEKDKVFFDKIIINNIRKHITNESSKEYIMIKDTSFKGVYYLSQVFPDDIHIILLRHPRDVFSSLFKSMNLKKKGFKYLIKRLTTPIGLYPYFYCKKVTRQVINDMPKITDKHYVLRYEDLVLKNDKVLNELKIKFCTGKTLKQIKSEIDNIEVINTSFIEETGAKHIWNALPKTKDFNPVNRKKHSYLMRKGIELGSKKLAEHLKY
ncbi:sulfotransferase [Aestuariibaculum sp. YM273]|uniref:sulfotransferase n=1 Tax=Aestuariibaculum sp. YM273 TaxID=3070659 RepID=UPI0027DD070B|nr:sulfotransferase [Aestuariibaculum sp. YM273]WMI65812.1 sulfotransferase [Aestuariibaculum sp. YM273]